MICLVYLPPENLPFYEGKEIKGIALLGNKLLDIYYTENVNLVIMGDLNARTSDLSDLIPFINNVPQLEEFEGILSINEDVHPRVSCD